MTPAPQILVTLAQLFLGRECLGIGTVPRFIAKEPPTPRIIRPILKGLKTFAVETDQGRHQVDSWWRPVFWGAPWGSVPWCRSGKSNRPTDGRGRPYRSPALRGLGPAHGHLGLVFAQGRGRLS
jgi:hypothetical protein